MPNPKRDIDLVDAEKLGKLQCTYAEASAFFDVPEGTLKGRKDFIEAFNKGKEQGKTSLRRTQFRLAEKSAAMAIWLGKQYLGQVDVKEIELPDAGQYFQKIADAISGADLDSEGVLP
jgi:hypothetical protein